MTGAPLPPGAEAVVPVEWTDGGSGAGPAAAMRRAQHRARRAPAARCGSTGRWRQRGHVRARGSDMGR